MKTWIGPCRACQISTLWARTTIVPSRPFPDPVNLLGRRPLGGDGGDGREALFEAEAGPSPAVAVAPRGREAAALPRVPAPGAACFEVPADRALGATASLGALAETAELLSPQPESRAIVSRTMRTTPTPPVCPVRSGLIENLP